MIIYNTNDMAQFQSKEEIKRQQLKNILLKRVIIRFDYTSIVNVQDVLNQIVGFLNSLEKSFGSFDQMVSPKEDIAKESSTESIGNSNDRQFVYRFTDCQIEPKQDVTLDFSRNFLCLDIRCDEHYTLIDPYLGIMSELMAIIIERDRFVQLTRIGIRKIDGVDSIAPDDADSVFEYFSQQLTWRKGVDSMKAREYTDFMFCSDVPAYVNYSRIVRVLQGSDDLRFTLDIDCYKDPGLLEKRPGRYLIRQYLFNMNDKLFSMFIMGIKLEYLNLNL